MLKDKNILEIEIINENNIIDFENTNINIEVFNKIIKINYSQLKKNIKIIQKLKKNNTILFDAFNTDKTRYVIERNLIDMIYNSEKHFNKEYVYQSNSGMDYVICKLMKSKNISYVFFCEQTKKEINKHNYKYLSRIKQNYKLCKKYKVNILIDSKECINLLESLK